MRKTIKKAFFFILCSVIMCVTAFAEGFVYKFEDIYANISFPMDYNVITLENIDNRTDIIEKLGFKKDTFKTMMEDQLAYAVGYSEDLSKEIWFTVYTDENAESIFNMDNFTEEDMEIFKNSVTADTTYKFEEAEFVESKNGRFFKTVRALNKQRSVTYVTIKNGAYYSVNLLQKDDGELTDKSRDDAKYICESIEFTGKFADPNDRFSVENIITIICVGALCVVSFAIIIIVLKKMGFIKKEGPQKLKTNVKSKRPILK